MNGIVELVIYLLVFTLVLGTLLSIFLRLPFALYLRLNGKPTQLSNKARRIIYLIAFSIALLIGVLVRGAESFLDRADNYEPDPGVTEAITAAAMNVAILSEFYAANGSYETFNTTDLYNESKFDTRDKYIESIDVLAAGDAAIAVIVSIKDTSAIPEALRGREVRYATEDGGNNWACSRAISNPHLRGDNLLPVNHLPRRCR